MTEEQYEKAFTFWARRDAAEKKMDYGSLYLWIDEFLKSHKILTLATSTDDFIRCTPLEYGWHDGSLWIFTEGGLKFRALKNNRHVAAAVFESDGGFGSLKSLQIEGTVNIVELFSVEYNKAAEFRKIPIKTLKKLSEPMWLLKVSPFEVTCLNSEFKKNGFCRRQIWRA